MGGFKNQQLNQIAKNNIYEDMINFIFISLEKMRENLLAENKNIKNDEEKIRTHLLEHYLKNEQFKEKYFDDLYLLFNAEVAEGYDITSEEYIGRVDIKVYSINTIINPKDYYIIECKRIDGSSTLNRKFITEGICRFILNKPKYSSYNKKNIMLGFVVKNIDIEINTARINEIQSEIEDIHICEKLERLKKEKEEYYLYRNKYKCGDKKIELSHLFYNLSDVIDN